ncbi:hypothetical protein CH371_16505 [Leptospira wolffii]|uniref:Uncharacterized protein n=1 Tax=Leptospira wolffii TaxID=409998 RepID=A0A2M9Z8J1_9LEPT|nr:hypothetical protein [Leptospira wolffii]PJZ64724.1 hypothetical protein CH371_16505 [Leptospira wolffii]
MKSFPRHLSLKIAYLLLGGIFSSFLSACYKSPIPGGLFDFIPLQTSYQALGSPGVIEVNVVGLTSVTVSSALVVDNSFGDPSLSFTADGTQNFSVSHKAGLPVSLTLTQPTTTPPVACSVFSPPTATAAIKTVFTVQCAVAKHKVSVKVFGVYQSNPSGLILANKVGSSIETLSVNSGDGVYDFPTQVGETVSYSVFVAASPSNHECFMKTSTSPAPTGTIGTSDITLFVNCLSAIKLPANVAMAPNSLQFVFSTPNVTGCGFSSGPVPNGYTDLSPQTSSALISYNNVGDTTVVTVSPTSTWGSGAQIKGWLSLKSCSAGGELAYDGNKNVELQLTIAQNVKYVNGGIVGGTMDCSSDMNACVNIQDGITACNATGQVCYVLVAQGNYILSNLSGNTNIILNAKTSLVGSFSTDFQSQGSDYQTSISDARTVCLTPGSLLLGASFCPVIEISPSATLGSGEILEVSNISIYGHATKQKVAPIFVYNYSGSGKVRISKTGMFAGKNLGVTNSSDERYGIVVTNANNVEIFSNIIIGGEGSGISAGAVLDNPNYNAAGYSSLYNNLIDGGSSAGLLATTYSTGIEMRNVVLGRYAVANNQINYYQYVNPGAPVGRRTVGIRFAATSSGLVNSYYVHNSVYAGNGSVSAKAVENVLVGPTSQVLQIFNNMFFGADTTGPNIAFDTSQLLSGVIAGNNYYGTTLLNYGLSAATYCPFDYQFTTDFPATCSPAGAPPAGFTNMTQYSKNVTFVNSPASYLAVTAFLPELILKDIPCDVRSGSVGYGIDSYFSYIQDNDFFFRPRTTSLYGRTLGAIEIDASTCSP